MRTPIDCGTVHRDSLVAPIGLNLRLVPIRLLYDLQLVLILIRFLAELELNRIKLAAETSRVLYSGKAIGVTAWATLREARTIIQLER